MYWSASSSRQEAILANFSFRASTHDFSFDSFTIIKLRLTNPSYKLLSNSIVKYR